MRAPRAAGLFIVIMLCVGCDIYYDTDFDYNEYQDYHDLAQKTMESPVVSDEELTEYVLSLPYEGEPCYILNENVPYFTDDEITTEEYETYSELDLIGRCNVAQANISPYTMPDKERGAIGHVRPSGWHTVKYNGVIEGNYLYNRCHLIAYELAGENANELNLITGTRYLNIKGMLPFENKVASYVKKSGNHVLYRVTPVFKDDEMVARGVVMEALSVEDDGEGVCFCVYAFNVQPGIVIDYSDGSSHLEDDG